MAATEAHPATSASEHPRTGSEGAGPALFRLIRYWARRGPQDIAQHTTGSTGHLSRIQVVDSISAILEDADPGTIVDIRAVATAMGVDRSVASRMVSDAVATGLVERGVATRDGRQAELTLTPTGVEYAAAARRWQEQVFAEMTGDWCPADRATFSRLLVRFCAETTKKTLKDRVTR